MSSRGLQLEKWTVEDLRSSTTRGSRCVPARLQAQRCSPTPALYLLQMRRGEKQLWPVATVICLRRKRLAPLGKIQFQPVFL